MLTDAQKTSLAKKQYNDFLKKIKELPTEPLYPQHQVKIIRCDKTVYQETEWLDRELSATAFYSWLQKKQGKTDRKIKQVILHDKMFQSLQYLLVTNDTTIMFDDIPVISEKNFED